MLIEKYTIAEEEKCNVCGNITECFQHYKLDNGVPRVFLTECGMCDMDTDPRGAESAEDLQNPNNWK